jgi:hypothetical protein
MGKRERLRVKGRTEKNSQWEELKNRNGKEERHS